MSFYKGILLEVNSGEPQASLAVECRPWVSLVGEPFSLPITAYLWKNLEILAHEVVGKSLQST